MNWVVGDIHGCAAELDDLLRAIRVDERRDGLWTVGDLVNRGRESAEAVRLWCAAGGRGVVGNHDLHAIRVGAGAAALRDEDDLGSLFEASDAADLLGYLETLTPIRFLPAAQDGTPVVLVHAGIHPGWSDLSETVARLNALPRGDAWHRDPDVAFATRARCCLADGSRSRHQGPPETCPPPYKPWDAFYRGESLVVHGHWALRGFHRTGRVIGLDSGCVYGGGLTAWCLEEDRVVRVPSRRTSRPA